MRIDVNYPMSSCPFKIESALWIKDLSKEDRESGVFEQLVDSDTANVFGKFFYEKKYFVVVSKDKKHLLFFQGELGMPSESDTELFVSHIFDSLNQEIKKEDEESLIYVIKNTAESLHNDFLTMHNDTVKTLLSVGATIGTIWY